MEGSLTTNINILSSPTPVVATAADAVIVHLLLLIIINIQGSHYILVLKFKDFQGPWICIFKDQFSMEVYSKDSIKATCNIYFCDYRTVLVDITKRENY